MTRPIQQLLFYSDAVFRRFATVWSCPLWACLNRAAQRWSDPGRLSGIEPRHHQPVARAVGSELQRTAMEGQQTAPPNGLGFRPIPQRFPSWILRVLL
jgi:hypothetical protein